MTRPIAELAQDSLVDGVYAVARKQSVPHQILVPVFPITAETLAHYPGWLGPIPASFEKPWPSRIPIWQNRPQGVQ